VRDPALAQRAARTTSTSPGLVEKLLYSTIHAVAVSGVANRHTTSVWFTSTG